MKSQKIKAIFVIIGMTVVWGGTFPLIKVMLNSISPMQLVSYRFFFASLFALPVFIAGAYKNKKMLPKLFLLGVILFLAYLAQTVGLKFTTSSKSGFITGLYIVFTPLFALLFVKEKPNAKILLALLLSVIGLALLSGVSIRTFYLNFGDLITVGAAIAYALQIVLTTIYVQGTNAVFVAAVQMIAMFLCSLPFNFSHFFMPMPPWILFSLLFLGGIAGYLSIIAEAYSLKYLDPDSASVIFTLEPVFAGVASFIFLKEKPTFYGLIGATLILVGMYLAVTSKTSYTVDK